MTDRDTAHQRVSFAMARVGAAVDQLVAQRNGACTEAGKWWRRFLWSLGFNLGIVLGLVLVLL